MSDSLESNETSENKEVETETLTGYIRVVSNTEAQSILEKGFFLSDQVFEVWDGKLPPSAYRIDTWESDGEANRYQRVVFLSSETAEQHNANWAKRGDQNQHLEYDQDEYPAVMLDRLVTMRFKPGETIDLTPLVIERIQDTGYKFGDTYEKLLSLSQQPLIDNKGNTLNP